MAYRPVVFIAFLLVCSCGYYVPIQVAPSSVPLEGSQWDVLGPVSATRCDPGNSLKATLDDALAQRPGANALVGIAVDLKVSPGFFFPDRCTTVSATAVKVMWRREVEPPPEAPTLPSGPSAAAGSEETTPLPGPCEATVKQICGCDGPPRAVVRRACVTAVQYQRALGDKCAVSVTRLRQGLRCVGDGAR
jgi:hypothetical protein